MDQQTTDYAAVRVRFPWVGLVDTGEADLSTRYRRAAASPGAADPDGAGDEDAERDAGEYS